MKKDINSIDRNMSCYGNVDEENVKWYLPYEAPLRLSGFAFFQEDGVYRRLPLRTKDLFEKVNPNLNFLCENTAGGQIAFRTNSTRILLKAEIKNKHNMVNMTAVGQSGFDCYIGRNGERLKFYGITRFDIEKTRYICEVVSQLPADEMRDVLLNFPLYEGVDYVAIGLDKDAEVLEPKPFEDPGKIVFYGTSITQGGCASRPGMAYTNILSRWLNRECINMGFSANGLGEPEMAQVITEIKDVSLVVLDYEANAATTGRLERTLEGFIDIIRNKYPDVPILVLSRVPYLTECYDEEIRKKRDGYRRFQENVVNKRQQDGDRNIYFCNGHNLWDEDFDEYTVDFIHPTDLGFWKMAEGLYDVIRKILVK